MRDRSLAEGEEGEVEEQHAVSAEFDESDYEEVRAVLWRSTAEGYDEAVENGVPFTAESEIMAWESADPVPVTEAEPIPADEIALQEAGRDLRPDTITPSPDITSSGVEAFEHIEEVARRSFGRMKNSLQKPRLTKQKHRLPQFRKRLHQAGARTMMRTSDAAT